MNTKTKHYEQKQKSNGKRHKVRCHYCWDTGGCSNCKRTGANGCTDCGYQKDYCPHCGKSVYDFLD